MQDTLKETLLVKTENTPQENIIESMRLTINEIDDQMLQLLKKRMECAQAIGQYKKQHNIPILQVACWQEILNVAIQKGQAFGLSDMFVTQFLTAIHDESIRQQSLVEVN